MDEKQVPEICDKPEQDGEDKKPEVAETPVSVSVTVTPEPIGAGCEPPR